MKKVMAFGTFDVFHKGHENFLKQAKKLGDYLIIVVARDKTVKHIKKQYPRNKEWERVRTLLESRMADEVVLGALKDKYEIIKKYKPDVIALGYDQEAFVDKLREKLLEYGLTKTKIVRLKPFHPERYKSSKIRRDL